MPTKDAGAGAGHEPEGAGDASAAAAASTGSGTSPPAAEGRPLRAAEKIRRTASELFYREGIRAVGVDEIVSRAGVTKPSLYRSFASKDALAGAYMADYDAEYWRRFDAVAAEYPGDPRAQVLAFFRSAASRAVKPGYRGCGMTNAVVEYPDDPAHPVRVVSEANKRALRARLRGLAAAMGAADADTLGDGLMLLLEGTYASGQLFEVDGPAIALVEAADRLIAAFLKD